MIKKRNAFRVSVYFEEIPPNSSDKGKKSVCYFPTA